MQEGIHVGAAKEPGGVHAAVDVAFVHCSLGRLSRGGEEVAIASRVDSHGCPDRAPALFALEDSARDAAPLQDRRGAPGVEQRVDTRFEHHVERSGL